MQGTIGGFGPGDAIALEDGQVASAVYDPASGELAVTGSDGSVFDLTLAGSYQQSDFAVMDGEACIPCFLAGTRILTASGGVRVEELALGDVVQAQGAGLTPIKWLGHRHIDCSLHPRPQDVWPIRIEAHAFGDGLPQRTLFLSPEHAVFVDGALVPARCLVNGVTIAQEQRDEVAYYHIELERHDVILAEGLPCESWLDCGHRAMFANCPVAELYPSLARSAEHAWKNDACAPLVEGGPRLEAIRARLDALAGIKGEDPAAHQAGELRGWIDGASREIIHGWAWQAEHPDHFARLEILAGDTVLGEAVATEQRDDVRDAGRLRIAPGERLLGEIVANERRPDVRDAGHGDGRCGFTFRLPQPLSPFVSHTIRVRRAADHAELWNSGRVTIEAASRLHASALEGFVAALCATAATASESERDALAHFLAATTDDLRTVCARASLGAANGGAARPLALFIDEALPVPDRDSASQVALDHMRALQSLGYSVAFAAIDASEGDGPPLEALGVTACVPPLMDSVEEMLRRLGADAALVYLLRVGTASLYTALARHHCPKALLVYGVADLHFLRTARQARVEGKAVLGAESSRLRERELLAATLADRVITHSPVEAAILRQHAPKARAHVVPWSVAARATTVPFGQRRGLAFIGGYRHAPNVDAANWLVDEIMPLVWREAPEIECLLVGSHMPDALRRITRAGIVPLGHVPDLTAIFDRVRLTAAPLRYGAGIKGKVLHSLAAGVPCVGTPVAAEGIALPPLVQGCMGETAGDLAARILRLHAREQDNAACAQAGLQLVREQFSCGRIDQAMKDAIGASAPVISLGDRRAVHATGKAPDHATEDHVAGSGATLLPDRLLDHRYPGIVPSAATGLDGIAP